jgi:carboxymethylenebutenolidase
MTSGLARYASQQTKLRDRDGRTFAGYFNDSATHASRAVIVAHDFFGLTPHIRSVASRLAREGFLAFAPDLYRGHVATTRQEAAELAKRLAWNQVAVELGLAVSALKERRKGMRVAVLGFAMGGAAALVAAAAVGQLDAAVTFYGIPQDVVVTNPRLRVQGHFAIRDVKCTPERVSALGQSLAEQGVASEIHRYDADNGFFNSSHPAAYAAEQAELAWARTVQFLDGSLA